MDCVIQCADNDKACWYVLHAENTRLGLRGEIRDTRRRRKKRRWRRRRDRIEDEKEKEKKEEMTMKKEWNQVHEMRKKYRTHLKGVLLAYIKMW